MKEIFLVALFWATLVYAENSAFDAGDISSNSSYGLTSNEKFFKEKLDSLSNENIQFNAKINEIDQRIEGLQSTLEGVNSQYAKSNIRLMQLEESNQNIENNLSAEIQRLKNYVEESRKIQEANNKQVKKILSELSSLVSTMNVNNLSKNELNDNNLSISNNSSIPIKQDFNASNNKDSIKENETKQIDDTWKNKNNNEILELAIKDIKQNAFEYAKVKLNFLIEKQHYKPARANFWLGEIEYKKKNYNNAILYYKKSSSLSTKGDYFPKLLYHTAISLDKIGDIKTANSFYKALKNNYPNSPEAKDSPNRK
ncbi:hypothetical protein N4T57_00410 [Campylobacter hepaticus]|uniref:Uncharacterized protein n=1 Tax=Campylobacter hepaticus TaxID=1813019 RepID=A0A424Z0Y5_9BACT|nr:tetratricopeptide repeat protein [Campylobacter hepaticus]AXP09147.1 hypothetical protein A2J15_005495 [Campylobacter hepaticus]MCZ0771642.1 hypothetical protein [Campylobacter hepaticus]MCZ0773110.1 hypothetical protein [Campylobacter hepaticus]MCZ0775790.1 hypothetical protein [Campylobacter hepaticus]MDX2323431.1 hypothetical protein [Campylobacter hepaticus]